MIVLGLITIIMCIIIEARRHNELIPSIVECSDSLRAGIAMSRNLSHPKYVCY